MFSNCSKLSSLPDISKWNTSNLENNDALFGGCNELKNKPTINKKKKGFLGFFK